jgi:hypothetical protein
MGAPATKALSNLGAVGTGRADACILTEIHTTGGGWMTRRKEKANTCGQMAAPTKVSG